MLAALARKYLVILPLAALLVILSVRTECNDCRVFQTGAELVGNGMYDPAAQAARQPGQPLLPFFRAPFYGLLLKPLLLIDFRIAWRIVNALAALLFFALAQHLTDDPLAPLWSLACPLFWVNFAIGQDAAIMTAILLGSMTVWRSGREFAAGALLALTLQKPTLLLLLPLSVWKGGRKMAAGYVIVAAVLAGVSLAVAGAGAVTDYSQLLAAYHEGPLMMPTIRGLSTFAGAARAWPWVAAVAAMTFGVLVYRLPFLAGVPLAVAGSLLISPGSFQHDLAYLAVPVCLTPARYVVLRVITAVQVLLVVFLRPASAAFSNGILLMVFCALLAFHLESSDTAKVSATA
jgi:hypothetical protein